MVGYGPEDSHFVVELTYNYGVGSYKLGNDFLGLTIQSREAIQRARSHDWPITEEAGCHVVRAPGGYKFFLLDAPQPTDKDPVQSVTLGSSNLLRSVEYWNSQLGMTLFSRTDDEVTLGYGEGQARLRLKTVGGAVDHAKAFGRIAFSCPAAELPTLQAAVKEAAGTILTPLVSLDTPGKATVQVVILGDPDGHEICFVGDETFRELSQVDPKGQQLLDDAMAADKSDEWFAEKGKTKADA